VGDNQVGDWGSPSSTCGLPKGTREPPEVGGNSVAGLAAVFVVGVLVVVVAVAASEFEFGS